MMHLPFDTTSAPRRNGRLAAATRLLPVLLALVAGLAVPACGADSPGSAGDRYRRLAPDVSVAGGSIFPSPRSDSQLTAGA